jgi:uncharacterized protein YbaA (DUF1428 family)
MARYVDGFVLVVSRKKLAAYKAIARVAGKVWRQHGALGYVECVGDDLGAAFGVSFPRRLALKRGELALFSWILYRSRAHRDRVNAKVMKDSRMLKLCGEPMPFDMKRMSMGGFRVLVDL